ncbi:ANK2 [Symbiodinium sp. CCMP2592]|nr:ANK2 [Symbiodinium sp. CCMP2592]
MQALYLLLWRKRDGRVFARLPGPSLRQRSALKKDDDGRTPLHEAAGKSHTDVAKVLLEAGADPNIKDDDGRTPLHEAAGKSQADTTKVVLKVGTHRIFKDGHLVESHSWNTLGHDQQHSDSMVTVMTLLVKAGADLNIKDGRGETPLHKAVRQNHLEAAKILLAAGADLNAKDQDGQTPLYEAADNGCLQTEVFLLQSGAEWNAEDHNGITPLGLAAKDIVHDGGCAVVFAEQWLIAGGDISRDIPDTWDAQRSCIFRVMPYGEKLAMARRDWLTYLVPAAGFAAACLFVLAEGCILHWTTKAGYHAVSDDADPFVAGARLRIAKARTEGKALLLVFRMVEVAAMGSFVMGFGMLLFYWILWVPLCFTMFALPAYLQHGLQSLLQAPVLAMASTKGRRSWSLLRILLLAGVVSFVWTRTHDPPRNDENVFFTEGRSPQGWERVLNPLQDNIRKIVDQAWPEQNLGDDAKALDLPEWLYIDRWDEHHFRSHLRWMFKPTAQGIFISLLCFLFLTLLLYALALVAKMVGSFCSPKERVGVEVTSPSAALSQRLLTEGFASLETELPQLKREQWGFSGVRDFFDSLSVKLAFIALDVFLDFNTIASLLVARSFKLAAGMTFIVGRSTLKQLQNIRSFREALKETVKLGVLHQTLLEIFEEEKGGEAFLSLIWTSYSYVFCVQSATQALIQSFSLALSVYGLASFLVDKLDLKYEDQDGTVSPLRTLERGRIIEL